MKGTKTNRDTGMGKTEETSDAATSLTRTAAEALAAAQEDRTPSVFPSSLPKYIDINYSRLFQIGQAWREGLLETDQEPKNPRTAFIFFR
jgi:hypothetical protein